MPSLRRCRCCSPSCTPNTRCPRSNTSPAWCAHRAMPTLPTTPTSSGTRAGSARRKAGRWSATCNGGRTGSQPLPDRRHVVRGALRQHPAVLDPPRAPGPSPGRDLGRARARVVRRGLALGHHVQVRAAAVLGQPRSHRTGVARARVPAVQVVLRDNPVAAQYPPHRLRPRPHPDHPDRDPRGDRPHRPDEIVALALEAVEVPVVTQPAVPQGPDEIDSLVKSFGTNALVRLLAGVGQTCIDGADAHRENRPATGKLVHRRHLAGHLPRPAPRQRGEQGAQADPLRAGGHGGQQAPRVHAVGRLPDEHAVPSGLLSEDRLLQLLGRRSSGQNETSQHDFVLPGGHDTAAAGRPRRLWSGMIRSHVSIRDSLVVLLTLTTGAVDAASFLALGNVFSSVITGNLVLLGVAAGTGRAELAVRSGVALAGYMAGVAAGAPLAARRHHAAGTWPPSVTV